MLKYQKIEEIYSCPLYFFSIFYIFAVTNHDPKLCCSIYFGVSLL